MYSYYNLLDDISYLSHFLIETGTVGASVGGRLIPYIYIGDKSLNNNIIITAAIHAREHVSALLVIKQVYHALSSGGIKGGGVYFVPMVNPDGNILCVQGANEFTERDKLIAINNGSTDFSLYKANLNGVDLNVNFDARWGTGVSNINYASSANYIGTAPFCQPESCALKDFTLQVKPKATISYHALGREVYWDFYQSGLTRERDYKFARFVNGFLGYNLVSGSLGSAGGYKDYCIDRLKIPALTIELVPDFYQHPLKDNSIADDINLNKNLPQNIVKYVSGITIK